MAQALLGLDLGTSVVKVIVVDARGRVLGRGSAEHPLAHPSPGAAEQNPQDWWDAAKTAIHRALSHESTVEIAAIGLTGQMHGMVLLDSSNRPVRPSIIWADTRSDSEVRELSGLVGAARIIQIAGSPLATGFQAASAKWVQANEPDTWRSVAKVLLPKDYLRLLLTSEFTTDPSDASSTLLLDVNSRDWSPILLDAAGIDRSLVPDVAPSASLTGSLTRDVAVELGLPEGVPVVAGGGDAPCGAIGAGVVDSSSLILTISTGAQALNPSESPKLDLAGRIHTFCAAMEPAPVQPGWYQMGATMVAGLALRWLRDDVFELDRDRGYEQMTGLAASIPPGADGLIFLPYLAGERTPHMNPHARGIFLGLTAGHGRGHLVRSVMEGVTFALYDAFEVLRETGARPATAILAGGGAQSVLWQKIVADVFGLEVVSLQTTEQSAMGAALLAGAGLGWFDLATTAKEWAQYGEPVAPDLNRHELYKRTRSLFRDAYSKHVEDFDRLSAIAADARLVASGAPDR